MQKRGAREPSAAAGPRRRQTSAPRHRTSQAHAPRLTHSAPRTAAAAFALGLTLWCLAPLLTAIPGLLLVLLGHRPLCVRRQTIAPGRAHPLHADLWVPDEDHWLDRAEKRRGTWGEDWTHGLGEVVTSLVSQGLRLETLREFDYTLYRRWPFLERTADGSYHMPAGKPRIPLMYSLKATKPA